MICSQWPAAPRRFMIPSLIWIMLSTPSRLVTVLSSMKERFRSSANMWPIPGWDSGACASSLPSRNTRIMLVVAAMVRRWALASMMLIMSCRPPAASRSFTRTKPPVIDVARVTNSARHDSPMIHISHVSAVSPRSMQSTGPCPSVSDRTLDSTTSPSPLSCVKGRPVSSWRL